MAPGALLNEGAMFSGRVENNGLAPHVTNVSVQKPWNALLHRDLRHLPLILIEAEGTRLKITDGSEIWEVLDGSGGAAVSNIGHKDLRVMQAQVDHFMKTGIAYATSASFQTEIAHEFAYFLLESTGFQMARVVFYGSGSEGMEAVQKLAIQYHAQEKFNPEPTRTMFIARDRSYHGATLSALGLSGHKSRRELFESVLPKNTKFISPCNPYRDVKDGMTREEYVEQLAQELEDKILEIGPQAVAGFVAEPVVGAALGSVPALDGYLAAMKKVCAKYGVLFILDEVMCGMGRTGHLHAWQEENVVPDLQVVGKGLAGGYQAISAVFVNHKIANAFLDGPGTGVFSHGHTFQNFPQACAAGLAVQKIIQDEELLKRVKSQGNFLQQRLMKRLEHHPHVGDVRGKGFLQGIEFVQDKSTKEPFEAHRNIAWRLHTRGLTPEHGIYVYPGSGTVDGSKGDHIIIAPAYNISDGDLDILIERVVKLINDFFQDEVPA